MPKGKVAYFGLNLFILAKYSRIISLNFKSFHKKYKKRCRNFYSSSIAGLFTGVAIGILFSLMIDSKFNRWINLVSYELFVVMIYFSFVFIVLYILYYLGKLCMWFFITKNKDELMGFKINYFAGIYAATFSASMVILNDNSFVRNIVALFFVLLYFPVEYYTVKNNRPK